jgi:hypothetical protein
MRMQITFLVDSNASIYYFGYKAKLVLSKNTCKHKSIMNKRMKRNE